MSNEVRATQPAGEPDGPRSVRTSEPFDANRFDAVELLRGSWGFGARYVQESAPVGDGVAVPVGMGPVSA